VKPVEDVFAARTDPLSEGADLVATIRDKGQILIGLKALTPEMIDDAALRLAIVAMDETDVAGVSLFGNGSADDQLKVPLSVTPVADVAAVQADNPPSIADRQILPIARVCALRKLGPLLNEIGLYPLGGAEHMLTYSRCVDGTGARCVPD
jgi:hypothetical protein